MKSIINIVNKIMVPVFILAICSMLFDQELKFFPYITYIRYFLLILLAIGVIAAFIELYNKYFNKK